MSTDAPERRAQIISFAPMTAQEPEGFVLKGVLTNASPDNTPYFKVGDALVLMLPEDSALLPGLRALEGKRVVISVFPD